MCYIYILHTHSISLQNEVIIEVCWVIEILQWYSFIRAMVTLQLSRINFNRVESVDVISHTPVMPGICVGNHKGGCDDCIRVHIMDCLAKVPVQCPAYYSPHHLINDHHTAHPHHNVTHTSIKIHPWCSWCISTCGWRCQAVQWFQHHSFITNSFLVILEHIINCWSCIMPRKNEAFWLLFKRNNYQAIYGDWPQPKSKMATRCIFGCLFQPQSWLLWSSQMHWIVVSAQTTWSHWWEGLYEVWDCGWRWWWLWWWS